MPSGTAAVRRAMSPSTWASLALAAARLVGDETPVNVAFKARDEVNSRHGNDQATSETGTPPKVTHNRRGHGTPAPAPDRQVAQFR
jgi:hypothetical protein